MRCDLCDSKGWDQVALVGWLELWMFGKFGGVVTARETVERLWRRMWRAYIAGEQNKEWGEQGDAALLRFQ